MAVNFHDKYPYTDFHELNLDWIIETVSKLDDDFANFVSNNVLELADPLTWNISHQYQANKIVVDPETGIAYVSVQPVPSGIEITNTDYWGPVFNFYELLTLYQDELQSDFSTYQNQLRTDFNTYKNTLEDDISDLQETTISTVNDYVQNTVPTTVTNWLAANIAQSTNPVIDPSLSTYGTAADARVTGQHIDKPATEIDDYDFILHAGGYVSGQLQTNGTITANTGYMTTGFLPVENGIMYELLYFGAGSYIALRNMYDASYNLLSSTNFTTISDSPHLYAVPDNNIKFVRYCFQTAAVQAGIMFHKTLSRIDKIDFKLSKIDDTLKRFDSVIRGMDYGEVLGYTMGRITPSTGAFEINQTDWVTTDYIPLKGGDRLWITTNPSTNFTLYRAIYDKNRNYISGTALNVVGERLLNVLPEYGYIRYSIRRELYYNNVVSIYKTNVFDYDKIYHITNGLDRTVESYAGAALDITRHNGYYVSKALPDYLGVPSGTTGQGFAVYNNALVQMFADNMCQILDINTQGALLGSFALTSGHGNTASFSTVFNASTDVLPLLYISDANTSDSDTYNYVYVHAISTYDASTLIGTIQLPVSTYGYNAQLTLDRDNPGYGYVVGCPDFATYIRSLKVSKVAVSGVNVTLIEQTTINFDYDIVLQGIDCCNDFVYVATADSSGLYNAHILTIDTRTAPYAVQNTISEWPDEIRFSELEGVQFVPNNFENKYDIWLYARTIGYYKMTF